MGVNVCRLCLGIVASDFKLIEDDTREIFDVIQLQMDLSISDEPVMCRHCDESLRLSLDFRSTCTNAEETIASFAGNIGDSTFGLRDVCPRNNENIDVVSDKDYGVCRLCVQPVKRDCCKSLDIVKENMALTKIMLPICLPDVKLMSAKEPIVCMTCIERLEKYLRFMKTCWDVEEKIREYCSTEGTTSKGQIQLSDVLKYMPEGDNKPILTDVIKVETDSLKTEKIEQVDIKDEHSWKLEQEEVYIKTEGDEMSEEVQNLDSFRSEDDLLPSAMDPQERISKITMYRCEECRYKTKHRNNFKCHMLSHKDFSEVTTYKCEKCTFKTKRKSDLNRHASTHKDPSKGPIYKCEKCTYKTKVKRYLRQHLRTHKDLVEELLYKCDKCTFKNRYRHFLKTHMLTHEDFSDPKMYKCEECDYKTKFKSCLTSHILKHKDTSEVVMYRCDMCTYTTKYKSNLKSHMLTHDSLSEVCNKTDTETDFKVHMLQYGNQSELTVYKCKHCSYKAKRKGSVKVHMLTHKDTSEVAMHKCKKCSHKTKYRSGLKVHMLSHKDPSEVELYKCEMCMYETRYKGYLKRHMKSHMDVSDVLVYKCDKCAFKTQYRYSLKRHVSSHSQGCLGGSAL